MEFLEYVKSLDITLPLNVTSPADINKALPLLRFPLDEKAIQESKAVENGKSYDMKGYSYQAHVDRMNLVFGTNWRFELLNEKVEELTSWNNQRSFYCHGDMEVSIGHFRRNEDTRRYEWIPVYTVPPVPTGHENTELDSARKGALTKGIKRATSILGVGADAYLGILDEDMSTGMPQQPAEQQAEGGGKLKYKKGLDWEQQLIGEPEYNGLILLAQKKGLSPEKLRTYYEAKSDGAILEAPSMLKKCELATVKMMLAELPDYVEPVKEEREEAPDQEAGQKQWPSSLEELLLVDESLLREIASEFSFQLPSPINGRNKNSLCKTLWMLMENKAKAAGGKC